MSWLVDQLHQLEPTRTENGGTLANKKGYHSSREYNEVHYPGNYSYAQFAADQQGPSDTCSAVDWTFKDAQSGDYATIALYSNRLYAGQRQPRLTGWREFFGQMDNDSSVEGYDFTKGRNSSSDSSHLWHIHLSEHRMWADSQYNKAALLSVLQGVSLAGFLNSYSAGIPWAQIAQLMRNGSRGMAVYIVQNCVGATADGDYGSITESSVLAYQRAHGLTADGIVGEQTWSTFPISSIAPTPVDVLPISPTPVVAWTPENSGHTEIQLGSRGELVKEWQRGMNSALNTSLAIDGIFGPKTAAQTRHYQQLRNLAVDGIVGHDTWQCLHDRG